ncbi:quinone oxidoreductase [Pseudomonas alcaligenes]|uniref:Quinone oxidoreductase n=1 Tax=Aquipseudomonas alcaligenes TaxID=43263 RepID=A0ABR7RW82_AQUAC|nr:zinc-binding dehydrogenase [Pseudomonas alcaligenes]MBC9249597.1 quinone oxidoreductase [Pseudomonas alcaligenes]
MRAIVSSANGPVVQDVPMPKPGPGQVLVRVRACSLNRADLLIMQGLAHGFAGGANTPMGLEWAGEVAEVGTGVTKWQVGDRVMGAGFAAFAEYTLGFDWMIYAIPAGVSYEQAATLPVALQTMHDAISSNGQLVAGQSVLIQGASSAVGLMGMQVAKFLGAGLVIGTSTSAQRRERLSEFGADLAIDTKAADWVAQVSKATKGKGVDLLIDFVAGSLINGSLQATRIGGRMVNIGRLDGNSGEFDFDLHNMRRITYIGASFRSRTPQELMAVIERTASVLGPAVADGVLKLPIDKLYQLDEAAEALARMARNEHFGKIVLEV